jgi:hypothetical protein
MNLPTEALRDLQRCGPALFRYAVALLLALCSYHCILFGIELRLPQETFPNAAAMAHLAAVLYFAVVISMAQAVYLSMLGAAIDRPLWKYKGAKDALQRFFILWFIINLLMVTLLDIQARLMAANLKDAAAFLEFVILAGHVMAMPVGACIMHWGALQWNETGEALRPLLRLFSMTMFPIVIGFIQFTLASARLFALTDTILVNLIFLTITDIPLVMIDAYIFALIWRICMYHRSLPPDTENPLDF